MNDDAGCKYVGMIFFFGTGSMYRINNIDAKNAQNPNSHFTAKSDRIYKSKLLCLVYLHRPIDYKNCLLSNKTEIASNTFILMHSYILCK